MPGRERERYKKRKGEEKKVLEKAVKKGYAPREETGEVEKTLIKVRQNLRKKEEELKEKLEKPYSKKKLKNFKEELKSTKQKRLMLDEIGVKDYLQEVKRTWSIRGNKHKDKVRALNEELEKIKKEEEEELLKEKQLQPDVKDFIERISGKKEELEQAIEEAPMPKVREKNLPVPKGKSAEELIEEGRKEKELKQEELIEEIEELAGIEEEIEKTEKEKRKEELPVLKKKEESKKGLFQKMKEKLLG